MIFLNNISLSYGEQKIFDDVSISINPGTRIGVVGDNGTGKTTLLRTILGEIDIDNGSVEIPGRKNIEIGFLPQEIADIADEPIIEYLKTKSNLTAIEEQLHLLEEKISTDIKDTSAYEAILKGYELLRNQFSSLDGYSFEAQAKQLLKGLGFAENDYLKNCAAFSGGWKMRIVLASVLLMKPSIMLLDEPTNHLDMEAMEWLENYLKDYHGTLIVVSHDRFFLDKIIVTTFEISNAKLVVYKGNFSFYLKEKERRRVALQKSALQQQQQLKQSQEFIERFRYKAAKAKQVQSRLKLLQRTKWLQDEESNRTAKIFFPIPPASAKLVCSVTELAKQYGSIGVFAGINFSIYRGQKVAIVGVNGAGKSTLMRIIGAQENASTGKLTHGERVTISFFSQESAIELNDEKTIWEHITPLGTINEQEKRNLLGAFLFSGNDIFKPVSVLSGGEKSRLALLKVLLLNSNFLLMDEPTNHLDIKNREILLHALIEYKGTLLLVSHDRYFLDNLINRVIEIKNGTISDYSGNYSYFIEKRKEDLQANSTATAEDLETTPNLNKSKESKRMQAEARNKLYKIKREINAKLNTIESSLSELEAKKADCERLLCDLTTLKNALKIKTLNVEYHEIKNMIEELSAQWEEVSAELVQLQIETFDP